MLAAIALANPTPAKLTTTFAFPDGRRLTHDLASKPDQWVMTSAADQALDRDFDRWPLISGRLDSFPPAR